VTALDLSGANDNDFIAGIGRDLTVNVAGQAFTLDGNTRLEILNDLKTQLLTAITNNTGGIAAKLQPADVVLDDQTFKLTLTARYGQVDALLVTDLTRVAIDLTANNAYQTVDLGFTNSYLTARVAGDVIKVEMGKTSASYTVVAGDTAANILNGLASALDAQYLVGSATATVNATTSTSTISVTANAFGPNVLGTLSEDEQTYTVRLFTNTTPVGSGFFAYEITAGSVTFDPTNPEKVGSLISVTTGADLVADNDVTSSARNTTTAAKDVTQDAADKIANADATNPDLLGDSALTGLNGNTLLGVDQDFVNPASGQGTNTSGNSALYGDNALTGVGKGVDQTFTNPDSSYTAIAGSPQTNTGNTSIGLDSLHGSNPGTLTDTGLNTTYLNGGTETAPGSGTYTYGNGNNPADNLNVGNGTVFRDGGTTGAASGTVTNSTSPTDGLTVTPTLDGFAPFEWDFSLLTVRSTGSSVADVVNNFQTAYDLVALESALLASTVDGDVTGVEGFVTQTTVTKHEYAYTESLVSSFTLEISFAWDLPSVDTPFTMTTEQNLFNSICLGLTERGGSYTSFYYPFAAGTQSFDNLADFVTTLNAAGGPTAPDFTARLGDDGKVYLSAPDGYYIGGAGIFWPEVSFTSSESVAFDLSTTEFGLVDSADSTIDTAALGFSTEVAAVLNSMFDFNAVLGGTTDNGKLNTTVFGVTAADNANVTAIWAHTQSTTGDNTVESYELNLLATVNTLGNEFSLLNFLPKPVTPVLPV
jgi:hypothetical protein